MLVLTEITVPAKERLRTLGIDRDFPYESGGELPRRGSIGTLVLSRFPVTRPEPLPVEVEHQNWLLTVDVPGMGPVRLAAVHPAPPLRGRSTWAADHRLLREALAQVDGPLIVSGDFNAVPSHWPMRRLRADGFRTSADLAGAGWQPTWPAGRRRLPPVVAIDHVLLSPELTATAAGRVRLPGSDHLGVPPRSLGADGCLFAVGSDDRHGGSGSHVDCQAEDVRPVVVAGRVEEPAGGMDDRQVDLGGQDDLLFARRTGQDAPGRIDDHRVARLHPLTVLRPVPERSRCGNRSGLVDVQARVDPDDVTPTLARNVPHGRHPASPGARVGATQMSTPCA